LCSPTTCLCAIDEDKDGNVWPSVLCGKRSTITCPGADVEGAMTRACQATTLAGCSGSGCSTGVLVPESLIDKTNCVNTALQALLERKINATNVQSIVDELESLTGTANDFGSKDFFATVNVIRNVVNQAKAASVSRTVQRALVRSTSNLLKSNPSSIKDGEQTLSKSASSATLPAVIEVFSDLVTASLANDTAVIFAEENVVVASFAFSSPRSSFEFPDRGYDPGETSCVKGTCTMDDTSSSSFDLTKAKMNVTPATGSGDGERFSFVLYQQGSVFQSANVASLDPNTTTLPLRQSINSVVVAARTKADGKFTGTIRFELERTVTTDDMGSVCAFWDFDLNSAASPDGAGDGKWSTEGCTELPEESTSTTTVCVCTHLTNFAVLTSGGAAISSADEAVLSAITYFGLAISLPCLLLTVLVSLIWPRARTRNKVIIMNLAGNLAVALVVFVFGVEESQDEAACTAVAVLLHYFLLAAFAWMLVEGYHLYLTFVVVFNTQRERQLLRYTLVGYGLPALVVIVTGAVQGGAGYGYEDTCWLNPHDGTVWAFIGPVAAVAAVNLLIFVRIMRSIGSVGLQTSEHKHRARASRALKASASFFCVMGVTWIFGVLAITGEVALAYLFTIFNVFQGVLIFVFHVALDRNVRDVIRGRKTGAGSSGTGRKDGVNSTTSKSDAGAQNTNSTGVSGPSSAVRRSAVVPLNAGIIPDRCESVVSQVKGLAGPVN